MTPAERRAEFKKALSWSTGITDDKIIEPLMDHYDQDLQAVRDEERKQFYNLLWLIAEDIVFICHKDESPFLGPQTVQRSNGRVWFEFSINVNDQFYWATADCEEFRQQDASQVIKIYEDHGYDGLVAMVALKRGVEPLECHRTKKYFEAKKALQS